MLAIDRQQKKARADGIAHERGKRATHDNKRQCVAEEFPASTPRPAAASVAPAAAPVALDITDVPMRAPQAAPLAVTLDRLHPTHRTRITHGLMWCEVCSGHASLHPRVKSNPKKLRLPCTGLVSPTARTMLVRLQRGLPPTRAFGATWPDGTLCPVEQAARVTSR